MKWCSHALSDEFRLIKTCAMHIFIFVKNYTVYLNGLVLGKYRKTYIVYLETIIQRIVVRNTCMLLLKEAEKKIISTHFFYVNNALGKTESPTYYNARQDLSKLLTTRKYPMHINNNMRLFYSRDVGACNKQA